MASLAGARSRAGAAHAHYHAHTSPEPLCVLMAETTTTSSREKLESALVARGVNDAPTLVAALDDLDGCLRTVAYWDAQENVSQGLLVSMLRKGQHRDYTPRSDLTFWQTGWHDLIDEMKALGFDDRLAPLAASAAMVRPKAVRSFERLDAHLRLTQPHLFEGAA